MNSRGQVYPLFGIMLTVLIGTSALSVDAGYYRYQQRVQQAATDSAAIAGAQGSFYDSTNANNYKDAAIADAKQNGFNNGFGSVTVTPIPWTDAGNCASGCVQVTIIKSYPVFFGSIFPGFANKKHQRQIRTIAAAKLQAVAGSCWTSLGPTSVTTTANGAKVTGPDCGVADADDTTIHGGTQDVATWSENAAGTNSSCGPCVLGLPPVDPCSVTPACQTLANATATDLGISSLTTKNPTCTLGSKPTTGTLAPGCRSGNFTISNQTLSGGLYVFTGTVTFDKTVTSNAGVTLYFAKGAQYADKTNANVTLTAPTSGDYTNASSGYSTGEEGILMYQAPDPKNTWKQSVQANINWTGLTYMPNWNVTLNGHSENITGNFAANSFTVNGGSTFNLNPGSGTTQGGPQIPTLVE